MRLLVRAGAVFTLCLAVGPAANAQVTRLVSVSSRGVQGSSGAEDPCISANGRFVAFASFSPNLVPDDTNDDIDVFVRDLQTGRTELVSVSSTGEPSNKQSFSPAISGDGRYVAFYSSATNLDPTHGSVIGEIYVRDRLNRTTQMVSVDASGHPSGLSEYPSISADGRFVAFTSFGDFGHDSNGIPDVWVRDLRNGTVECASVPSGPVQEDSPSFTPFGVLSADGRYVVFETFANNIIPGVRGPRPNVFLRDRLTGSVELINVDLQGNPGIGGSVAGAVSADGRYVLFGSASSNLVRGDTNDSYDVFVRDRVTGTTERESVSSEGIEGDADSSGILGMTPDGRYVVFPSIADNLVPGGTNGEPQVFLRDRATGTTELISLTSAGVQELGESLDPSISDDGRLVAFDSGARLVPGDTTLGPGIYVRERDGQPGFTSPRTPSLDGGIRCPCSNDARRGDRVAP